MDVGDDSIRESCASLAPIQILDVQHNGHVGLVTELHTRVEQSVHVRLAFLLVVNRGNEGYGEASDHILAVQHNVGQFQLRRRNLHSQCVTEQENLERILLLVARDAESR